MTPGCMEECFSDGQCVIGPKAAKSQQIGVGCVGGELVLLTAAVG